MNGHRPEEGENVEPTKEDKNCCFEEISRLLKLQYCAIINDETICYGCYKHCYKSAKNAIITDKKLQKCACKKCFEGDKKDMILNIMIQILDNYKEEKYINTRTFFHLLFMKYLRFSYDLLKIYSYAFQMIKMVDRIIIPKIISSFLQGDTFLLFWNFFWGLIAICYLGLHFAYSLQLFSIK